jgi:hypothetical protein
MILVDTSMWIQLLAKSRAMRSVKDLLRFVTCGVPDWHRDRDFGAIARYTGLDGGAIRIGIGRHTFCRFRI